MKFYQVIDSDDTIYGRGLLLWQAEELLTRCSNEDGCDAYLEDDERVVELPIDLFNAIRGALNEIVNQKLDHGPYKDTYSIASALGKISRGFYQERKNEQT